LFGQGVGGVDAPPAPVYFFFFKNSSIAFRISHETERSCRVAIFLSARSCAVEIRKATNFTFIYTLYNDIIHDARNECILTIDDGEPIYTRQDRSVAWKCGCAFDALPAFGTSELENPAAWWWLSFSGNGKFLGVVILYALDY
jgi:hypothetical protein